MVLSMFTQKVGQNNAQEGIAFLQKGLSPEFHAVQKRKGLFWRFSARFVVFKAAMSPTKSCVKPWYTRKSGKSPAQILEMLWESNKG